MKKYYKKNILNHFGGFVSIFVSLFNDLELVKGFKETGGLKSVLMAFKGKNVNEINEQIIYDKIKLEECVRAKIAKELEN